MVVGVCMGIYYMYVRCLSHPYRELRIARIPWESELVSSLTITTTLKRPKYNSCNLNYVQIVETPVLT